MTQKNAAAATEMPKVPKKILSAKDILAASRKAHHVEIESPELGGFIRVRGMSAAQAGIFMFADAEQRAKTMLEQIPLCIIDESNERIFTTTEEIDALLDVLNAGLFVRLMNGIIEASGLTDTVQVAKNDSGGTGGDASSSASA